MLDAYIIEKIKREQERDSDRLPLRIETPKLPERPRSTWQDRKRDDDRDSERGVVIIDF